MKYKIVGWTDYDNEEFKEMVNFTHNAYLTLIREIREQGYTISGYDHQENGWVPIFNTGEIIRMTQRGWGGIMADVIQFEQKNGYEYSIYGVGGAVMGYNDESIYLKDDIDFPNIEDICDTYKIVISEKTFNNYQDGETLFRFFINEELSSSDNHDHLLLTYKGHVIKTEIMCIYYYEKSKIDDQIEACRAYEEDKESKYIYIVEPNRPYDFESKRKSMVLRILSEYEEE